MDGDTISQDDDPSAAETAATVIVLSAASWDQLTAQLRTVVNLHLAGDVAYERGSFGHLAAWEPALKLLHAGIPVFEPGRADFAHHDPTATFTLGASDDDLRDHLLATGFLHLRHVFDPAEIAAANAEIDRLAELARPDDDRSWWVTAADDSRVLCRLVYATQRSEGLAALAADPGWRGSAASCGPTCAGPTTGWKAWPSCSRPPARRRACRTSRGTRTAGWADTRSCARQRRSASP